MSPDDPDFLAKLEAIEREPIWLDADGVAALARAARELYDRHLDLQSRILAAASYDGDRTATERINAVLALVEPKS